ncbi:MULTISPECIES: cupin domain-containing protein [unclassified Methylophilus]|uniref:cupin domain-containing protein n=1 Tax=unclassified Methylophilus TaxID=2630143 RepID=UPI0006F276B5|nr:MULTISPECIES: cupin domain-containing protein [unclassified Methylophilus]KQT41479.1 cupin [Methylophilus sp. Leaf416]KQT58000.1 cupin [Methylophilus sp. Leaf459]
MQIQVQHNPAETQLNSLGVSKWPTWQKEVSVFDWTFHEEEKAYILAGECVVTPIGGAPVSFGKGDFVIFPAGLKVKWEVKQPLHKHYQLDGNVLTQSWKRLKAALKLT